MSKLMIVAAVLALLGTLSCTGTGVNTAPVFQAQSNQIQLTATTADTTFTSVEFVVNEAGTPITIKDENLADGIAVTFDTTQVDDGINFVKAYGVTADGQRVEILDNSLLVDNGGAGGTGGNGGGSASPSPSAASGTSPAGSDAGSDTEGDLGSDTGVQFRRR